MHIGELTQPEQRVLGCLIEKRWTTPEQYPLSLNALRLACNQSTNRDPVTDYDESTIREAAERLSRYGLTRLVYAEQHDSILVAKQRERNLKHWPRAWKVQLIEAQNPEWTDLYDNLL